MSKLRWLLSRTLKKLWVRVSLFALLGVAAAAAAWLASRFLKGEAPLDISSEAIDSLLTIIASSMLAVTTFSVGALTSAYGSATSNATPRATPLLTEDQVVQNSLATFVGSFLFSIVGLIALKVSFYGPEGRAVLFLVTLVVILLIVLALLRWINQLTKLGRVADTISRIEEATSASMRARIALPFLGGRGLPDRDDQGRPVRSQAVGYVQFIDTAALSQICEAQDFDIDVHVLPGSFVYTGSDLAHVRPAPGAGTVAEAAALPAEAVTAICGAFTIGTARTMDQDPRFGLVVLSEVAQRALSPAVNDPGTAIDVIGRQTRLLSFWGEAWQEAERSEPDYPRVRVPALVYHDLFEDAFNLIARDGAGQVDVMLRLVKGLQALTRIGPDGARAAARQQLLVALSRAKAKLPDGDDLRRLQAAIDPAGAEEPRDKRG